jgi:hypothetical protein
LLFLEYHETTSIGDSIKKNRFLPSHNLQQAT